MNVKEMLSALRMKRTALFAALRSGIIPAKKRDGHWYISEKQFDHWVLRMIADKGEI